MPEYDCRRCDRWKGCPGKEWYHYGEIRWCPQQVIWILQHAEVFRAGQWPAPRDDSPGSTQINPEAYFVKAGIAISEVEDRLDRTPNKGEILLTQVEDGRTLDSDPSLSHGARAVLMYVKGSWRKRIGFKRWSREREQSTTKTVTF